MEMLLAFIIGKWRAYHEDYNIQKELDENQHNILVKENACYCPIDSLSNPQSVTEMLNTVFRLNRQAEEYVYMIALNTKGKSLGVFELSHNHPSGDTTPSKEDIAIYNKVKESGKLMNISLLDNIIIGNGYFSFMDNKI